MRKFCILGATGSIGTQALDIILENPEYCLEGFSFGNNIDKAIKIIEQFNPKFVYCHNTLYVSLLKNTYPKISFVSSNKELVSITSAEYIINSLVGFAGLEPSIEALKLNKKLLLANKESLVVGGVLLNNLSKNNKIVPIDSEHSALLQLLNVYPNIKKAIITASGGALRDYNIQDMNNATSSECLKHPTWQMGKKITIDSATLMNKVFELVEAAYLFDFDIKNVDALICRDSRIHALVIDTNDTVYFHESLNDMHLPIKYSMEYPNSTNYNDSKDSFKVFDFQEKLNLEPIDSNKYPLINLAEVIINNKFGGVIINACNEVLVGKFLNDKINYVELIKGLLKISKNINRFDEYEYNFENLLKINNIIVEEVEKW